MMYVEMKPLLCISPIQGRQRSRALSTLPQQTGQNLWEDMPKVLLTNQKNHLQTESTEQHGQECELAARLTLQRCSPS